jgi:A/G-specific adenine glycosylase
LRAVRLHALACQVMIEFDGQLPRSTDGLMRLNGIGRYTAGAIACFAYEQPVAMVDTNVRRVLSRVLGLEPRQVDDVAQSVLPTGSAYAWNQALMDLGATLCRPRQPLCLVCPLMSECGGPRPSAAPVRRAAEFRGSSRYYRGRILDELRRVPNGARLALRELAGRVDDRIDLIAKLAAEGLIEVDADRQVRLAE